MIKLSAFRYVVEHISGEINVWAYILTRWAVWPRNKVKHTSGIKSLILAPINPWLNPKLDWFVRNDIIQSQNSTSQEPPQKLSKKDSVWRANSINSGFQKVTNYKNFEYSLQLIQDMVVIGQKRSLRQRYSHTFSGKH